MKTETYERLRSLHDKYGPKEFGKLCQKFLAISFKMAGYNHIVERGVQGVDVDAAEENGDKFAIEVKTTVTKSITFGQKDVDGLQKRKEDGYQALIAVLRLNRFSNWIFARADVMKPGNKYIDSLRVYRLNKIEECITSFFDEVIKEHHEGAMCEGQKYLDEILRQKGVDITQ
jgi:Holliday junction resolvase